MYTDEETREEFKEYAKQDPIKASYFYTLYYFAHDGGYGKVSVIWPQSKVRISEQKLIHTAPNALCYKSEMTPEDFELAGQALQMLIKRLKPQEEQEMDSGSSPE